jgi:hypothetical protein
MVSPASFHHRAFNQNPDQHQDGVQDRDRPKSESASNNIFPVDLILMNDKQWQNNTRSIESMERILADAIKMTRCEYLGELLNSQAGNHRAPHSLSDSKRGNCRASQSTERGSLAGYFVEGQVVVTRSDHQSTLAMQWTLEMAIGRNIASNFTDEDKQEGMGLGEIISSM